MWNVDTMVGRVVDIVGIAIGDQGRSCEDHRICGMVLAPGVIVRLRKEEIMVEGRIEVYVSMAVHRFEIIPKVY